MEMAFKSKYFVLGLIYWWIFQVFANKASLVTKSCHAPKCETWKVYILKSSLDFCYLNRFLLRMTCIRG